MPATPTIIDQWSDGKRTHVIGSLAFTGNYATGGDTLDLSAVIGTQQPPLWFNAPVYHGYLFQYNPSTLITNGKLQVRGSGNATATGTLTSDNTNVANNDTVTIGTQVYTFKTALTASTTAYEVLIGGNADASLLNLIRAINLTGTPGTDYGSLTPANSTVSAAAAVTAHAFLITALISGTGGNAVASTETSAHLSFGAATLTGGVSESTNGTEISGAAYPTNLASFTVPFYAIFPQLY